MSDFDPTRAPDWLFREAQRRATSNTAALGPHDPLMTPVVTYLRHREQARTHAAREQIDRQFPKLSKACRIRFGDDRRRDSIEIRLLAGSPPHVIALLSALDAAVVWVYLSLFYDILDRLHCGDFIYREVILNPSAGNGSSEGQAMRYLAWLGGPMVADALLLPSHRFREVKKPDDVDGSLMEFSETMVKRAIALAPLLDRLNADQIRYINRLRIQSRHARDTASGDTGQQRYEKNVKAFLDNIELRVGRASILQDDKAKYFSTHVEPTPEEWAAIRRGEDVSEFDQREAAAKRRRQSVDQETEGDTESG